MKLGLQTKILLVIGCAIFLVLSFFTLNSLGKIKQQALKAVEWQAQALAQSILYELQKNPVQVTEENILQEWPKYTPLCQQVFAGYENHVTHVSLIDGTGAILASSHAEQEGTSFTNFEVFAKFKMYRTTTTYREVSDTYHTFIPVFNDEHTHLGVIDIGTAGEKVAQALEGARSKAISLLIVFQALSCLMIFLSVRIIVIRPIQYLAKVGERLAEGYPIHSLKLAQRGDEIALMGSVLVRISDYLSEITEIAEDVATGALAHDVRKRSKRDVLGVALQDMLRYLQTLADIASCIAKGDLTVIPSIRSDIDAFGRSMRDMISGLQALIQQIRDSSEQISGTGSNLANLSIADMDIVQSAQTSVEQMISTVTELGNSAEEVAHNMDVLSTSVEQTSASVSSMAESITNIAENATDLSDQTQNAIVQLNKSTSLLEEVTEKTGVSRQLSEETIEDALEGQQAVEEVTKSMDTIQQTNSSTVETITRFEQQTQDIGSILDVIDEITDQSSLLALNASIIAAQAGSHGRGFAVIADEMRNLANKVSSSTKDIAAIVKVVQEETKTVVKKIHEGTSNIEQGVKRTQQAREVLHKIFTSAQRSSDVVKEIGDAIQKMQQMTNQKMKSVMVRVDSMTAEITEATMEQKVSTIQIDQTVEHIAQMAAQTQHATTEQLLGVNQILESVERVRLLTDQNVQSSEQIEHTASELSVQAQILLQSVDRFKLGRSEMIMKEASAKKAVVEDTPERQALKGKM